jgi:uncharacterized protein involved in outer membrane biogenesis
MANAPWGKHPDMLHVGQASAQLNIKFAPFPSVTFGKVILKDAILRLERDSNGVGNWKKHGNKPSSTTPAKSRTQFPTMLDLQMENSLILLDTSSGGKLQIGFNALHLATDNDTQPITIIADGSYNSIPVRLDIKTDSYTALSETDRPFGVSISAQGAATEIKGTFAMADPLNFDGLDGSMQMDIKNLGEAGALLGAHFFWDVPLHATAALHRDGDHWTWKDLSGSLAHDRFNDSSIHIDEGKHRLPDAIETMLNFEHLNIGNVAQLTGGGPSKSAFEKLDMLTVSDPAPVLLDAQVNAHEVSYRKIKASQFKLEVHITNGKEAIKTLSMKIFGGDFHASAEANSIHDKTNISAKARLTHADLLQMAHMAGADGTPVTGTIDVSAEASTQGGTLNDLSKSLTGTLHLSAQGSLTRHMVHIASMNIKAILKPDRTLIPLECVRSTLIFKNGIGTLSPFIAQTSEGTLAGEGFINLPARLIDFTFQTDPKSTAGLALNLPVHVKGLISDPHVAPSSRSESPLDWDENAYRCK